MMAQVYKAVRSGVTIVAVKMLSTTASMDLKSFRQEAHVLASCRDPHICQFLGACFQPVSSPNLKKLKNKSPLVTLVSVAI